MTLDAVAITKKRLGISDFERLSLRRHAKSHPTINQRQLAEWFHQQFHHRVTQGMVSLTLSNKYSYLDTNVLKPNRKRNRPSMASKGKIVDTDRCSCEDSEPAATADPTADPSQSVNPETAVTSNPTLTLNTATSDASTSAQTSLEGTNTPSEERAPNPLPRVTITYCTQCRWLLRAAYYAQELLTTFSMALGQVSLVPATGGVFKVHLTYQNSSQGNGIDAAAETADPSSADSNAAQKARITNVLLWDYKIERSFPETKLLKQKVRDYVQPDRNLGHSDTPSQKAAAKAAQTPAQQGAVPSEQTGE